MAGTTGLEPATSAVTGQRSNQLSYVPARIVAVAATSTILSWPSAHRNSCDSIGSLMMRALVPAVLALASASAEVIHIETPMPPPEWAFAERALLKESVDAAVEFAAKYVDPQGHFRAVERWGGNDGPDDVMETFDNWPL